MDALGLFPLQQQRSRKVKATYEVDHDKVIMGIATAATAGAIRVQASLERRLSLWGIWRIHLVQDKAEEGAGSLHWGQVTVNNGGFCKRAMLTWGGLICPGRAMTPYHIGNFTLTMGSASSSSKFLGANMAKGMSKLVNVT